MLIKLFKRKKRSALQDNLQRLSVSTYDLALAKLQEGVLAADIKLNKEQGDFVRAKKHNTKVLRMRQKIDSGLALNDLEALSVNLIRL